LWCCAFNAARPLTLALLLALRASWVCNGRTVGRSALTVSTLARVLLCCPVHGAWDLRTSSIVMTTIQRCSLYHTLHTRAGVDSSLMDTGSKDGPSCVLS
jgi:hypothetical protein